MCDNQRKSFLLQLTSQFDSLNNTICTGEPTVLRYGPHFKGACLTTGRPFRTDHTGSARTDIYVLTVPTVSSHSEHVSSHVCGVNGWGPIDSEG